MSDQDRFIDATMARSIQADAERKHPMLAWVVTRDEGTYRGQFVARLLTNAPTPYVLPGQHTGGNHTPRSRLGTQSGLIVGPLIHRSTGSGGDLGSAETTSPRRQFDSPALRSAHGETHLSYGVVSQAYRQRQG